LGGKNGQLQIYELPTARLLKAPVPVPVDAAAKRVAEFVSMPACRGIRKNSEP
jgi:hypothetical protein